MLRFAKHNFPKGNVLGQQNTKTRFSSFGHNQGQAQCVL